MGVSFYYYGHIWVMPVVILIVALAFGILFFGYAKLAFWVSLRFGRYQQEVETLIKALALFFASYIHPFGFNWFKSELILLHTPFGVDKLHFGLFLLGILALLLYRTAWRSFLAIAIFLLLFAINPSSYKIYPQEPEGKIVLSPTKVDVRDKWRVSYIDEQIRDVLQSIDRAIANKKRVIILPESVFPFFLNESEVMLNELKKRSMDIDIILGALYHAKNQNRNSIYIFQKGNFRVGDKIVLVPFGEENPLPDWASKWINRIFFDGAPDYTPAKSPTDFKIGQKEYRGAICYEGTSDEIYRDIPKRLIVISNNGWFFPSIEPTLQRLLFEYYVVIYKVRVYHCSNYFESFVIVPE
jgi:apolipoprotein N-acyltransferase